MSTSKVILSIVQGTNHGVNYVFGEPAQCLIGRAPDCDIRLPSDPINGNASRYHSLLIIDPPRLRALDLGSLNGTYVNGKLIGKRCTRDPSDTALLTTSENRDLKDGDELRVGSTVLRVAIAVEEDQLQLSHAQR
jgi:pSer/pThr/pTyr-binding forkhead associated (FHA) protein